MTRAISLVGWTRSPINPLTDPIASAQQSGNVAERRPLRDSPFLAHDLPDPVQLPRHAADSSQSRR